MENFLTSSRNRVLILLGVTGLILVGVGIFFFKSGLNFSGTKVEVLNAGIQNDNPQYMTVEISGEVIKPGVYKLLDGSRVDDLLVSAGGFSNKADRIWTDKYLNRAAKITDGQKIFIPQVGEQSSSVSAKNSGGDQSISSTNSPDSNALININSSSLSQLDALPGIGQVYGQSIIDHRPYSNISELLSKGALKTSVYNKVKELVTVY